MVNLQGKVVLVIGANGGIGAKAAIAAGAAGAKVACADIVLTSETLKTIEAAGGTGMCLQCNVLSDQSCQAVVKAVEEKFGPIYAVCYLAGVVSTVGLNTPFAAWPNSPEYIMSSVGQLDIHVGGPWRFMQTLIPKMLDREADNGVRGMFITMSSLAAVHPAFGKHSYNTSKGAVSAFVTSIAGEFGPKGIISIGVLPNRVETPVTLARASSSAEAAADMGSTQASGKMIGADEVAELFIYLLRNGRAHSGDLIPISDGGMFGLKPTMSAYLAVVAALAAASKPS